RVNYPADRWEALVVDDASTDETLNIIPWWIGQNGAPVRYVRQSINAGPAAARNRGASEAKGEYLIFIDNDIIVEPDFIHGDVDTLSSNPGCWVVGRIIHPPKLRATPFGRYRDSVWENFHESHGGPRISETAGMTAANLSLPAKDFETLRGFDEDF